MKTFETITKKTVRLLTGWGALFFLWWILSENSSGIFILLIGALISLAVIFLYYRFDLSIDIPTRSLTLPLLWLKFFFFLVIEILKTTVKTCYFIINGEIEPKIIAYKTELKTGYGLLFLLNSITLTPTTIAVISEKNLVYIHHLKLKSKEDYEKTSDRIHSYFEDPLKKLIG